MKKIVIVGGGFAGSYCAKKLEEKFNVTLIDREDYFEFTPSILRALTDQKHISKIIVHHKKYLEKAKVVKGEVREIDSEKVTADGNTYFYDYLIICSGSKYNTPIKQENLVVLSRIKGIEKYAERLRNAKLVLIIGGGIVGVELAAEILGKFPDKQITLVHSKKNLLERSSDKARKYAQNFLSKKGVKIILNQTASEKKGFYFTNKEKIKADIAFWCTGISPNYEFLKKCSVNLNERNFLCVNKHLQVNNYQNVFAGGDITNIAEEKTAQNAEEQAKVIVKNIFNLENNKPLNEYKTKERIMVISLGQRNGMITYKNLVITGYIAGLLKRMIEWKTMRRFK